MSLQSRRSGRPRGQAGLAPVGDIPGEPITDANAALPGWDGITWPQPDFTGASTIGLMTQDASPVAIKETGKDTQPLAMLRAQHPPAFGHEGYAPDATGPMAVLPMPPAIGDALARDPSWGARMASQPCGHCGGQMPVQASDVLERARALGHANWRAKRAGWKHDTDLILTCPACQDDPGWKARQGQVEVHGGPRRAAALAVDVMLARNDYADITGLADAAERRNARRFDGIWHRIRANRAGGAA